MAAFDFGLLQGMPQDQAIPLLQQLLASGQLSPLGAAPLTGMPGYSPAYDYAEGGSGPASHPGTGQWLTPDGTYNGQQGAYVGQFNNGQLQNAYFDPKEAYGFADQWGGPLAIAGAALGGGMLANSGFGAGAGAVTDVGVNSAIAGGMDGAALGGAGGIGGAPISASVPSFTAGGGGFESLGGAGALIPAASALASGISAAGAPKSATSTTDIPEWARPYATDLLSRAQTQSQQPFTPYGGPNPFQVTQDQTDAIGATRTAMDQFGDATAGARNFLGQVQSGARDYAPGQIDRASNSYIGQTTPGALNSYIGQGVSPIQGPASVMGLADRARVDNPFINQTSGQASTTTANPAGRNALLGMDNPYLNSAIDQAMGDVSRQYNLTTAPQRQAQAVASGSFGNTGVQQMQGEDQRQLASELGRVSTGMRMADYGLQANLGEGQAGREQATNIWNAGALNQGGQFNTGVRAQDLGRQTGAFGQQGQFNAGNLLNAGMFDVGQGQRAREFNAGLGQADLTRNAQLAGQQGQFNASLAQGDIGRNANLTQGLSQFNSGVSAQDIGNQFGAWQGNNNLAMGSINPTLNIANNPIQQAQSLFNMGQSTGMTGAQGGLFDYGQHQAQQQYPWQQIGNLGSALGSAVGRSGTTTQPLPTQNPWAAALGGGLMGAQLYNAWNR